MILKYEDYKKDRRIKTKNNFSYILPENWYEYELKEWLRCKLDPLYFIKNYIYVMKEDKGERFLLKDIIYQPQEDLILNLLNKRKVIQLKSRQTGITTIISQLCQYLLLFNRQYKVGILSHKSEHQSGFIDRKLKTILNYLPPIFLKPVTTNNIQQIIFQDGDLEESWIQQEAPGQNSFPFTGETMNFIFMDEQQKINFIEKHFSSMTPSMSTILIQNDEQQKKRPSGICIVSTPNGIDGIGKWFYKKYLNNLNQTNPDYYPMFIHWKDCGLDEQWYLKQKSLYDNDLRLIRQELDQEFLGSGETYYDLNKLIILEYKQYKMKNIEWSRKQQDEIIQDFRQILQWDPPTEEGQYIIGVDPQDSEGNTSDNTQIEVIDQYTQCQVQEWNGKINTVDMQYFILELQKYYNNQTLGIEKNKGFHLIDKLLYELNYDNILNYKNANGITVTQSNRKQIIDNVTILLPEYDKDKYDFIRSKNLIDELFSFEYKTSTRVEQKSGKHDDLVFQFCYQLYTRELIMPEIMKTNNPTQLKEKIELQQLTHQYDMVNLIKSIRG